MADDTTADDALPKEQEAESDPRKEATQALLKTSGGFSTRASRNT
jgi:hypothetical protein